jgi:hypothetical protein
MSATAGTIPISFRDRTEWWIQTESVPSCVAVITEKHEVIIINEVANLTS